MNDNNYVRELAEKINMSTTWDLGACEELCCEAGLGVEWETSDGDNFEAVVYHAAEILGVEI